MGGANTGAVKRMVERSRQAVRSIPVEWQRAARQLRVAHQPRVEGWPRVDLKLPVVLPARVDRNQRADHLRLAELRQLAELQQPVVPKPPVAQNLLGVHRQPAELPQPVAAKLLGARLQRVARRQRAAPHRRVAQRQRAVLRQRVAQAPRVAATSPARHAKLKVPYAAVCNLGSKQRAPVCWRAWRPTSLASRQPTRSARPKARLEILSARTSTAFRLRPR